ncbi:MAG: GNAT family N-acetyltransferase, partial [Acidobacteriota bacterium]
MTSFWVRSATAGDLKAVRSLASRVGREFLTGTRSLRLPGEVAGNDLVWVVEAGRGEIVGSCALRESAGGTWELHSLYLAPEYRGFGLGKSLAEHAIRVARQ